MHLHASLKACRLCCHTQHRTQDTARLVLIKGIKCYSDAQQVGPAHEKRPWLFGFYGADVWLAEHDSDVLYNSNRTAAFMSIKHI